eukprot:CAMPEP_0202381642 /NCGR_PEP_ID=MMETSP1127-20130417/37594_1 /ASSEMBLY_ACC=CAM_ASM_000462 /TAXON_ID=3047 /ORGANISM="Dunaliella tertiolecta, Strain CCMP1320" /LENGTH=277 /DNA_ID=CAMNT_0048980673 /DNA_START=23 /DNA_END=856 /DNA_ORIENTATION=+
MVGLIFCIFGLQASVLAQGGQDSSCSCDSLREQLASSQAQLGQKSNELRAVQLQLWERMKELSQKTSELSQKAQELSQKKLELQRAQQASQDLSLAAVASALSRGLKNKSQSLQGEVLLIFEEAKQGKFDRVHVLGLGLLDSCRGAASSVYAFIATEADEHLPPPAKAALRSWCASASSVWHAYVVEAAWAAPVVSRVKAANQELMAILTLQLRAVPSLQPYSDPAFVQLLVYAIFGLPLLLLVILPLALLLSTRKAEDEAPQSQRRGNKVKSGRRA